MLRLFEFIQKAYDNLNDSFIFASLKKSDDLRELSLVLNDFSFYSSLNFAYIYYVSV